MNSIESQFLPYEQAVKLKELGFDWECIYCWGKVVSHDKAQYMLTSHKRDDRTDAPLYSQAFDWFRVEHNAIVCWNWHSKGTLEGDEWILHEERTTRKELINWSFEIDYYGANFDLELTGESDYGDYGYDTYESARLACLEKLIELVKEKLQGA